MDFRKLFTNIRLVTVFYFITVFSLVLMGCSKESSIDQIPELKYMLSSDFSLRLEGVPTRTWMIESKKIGGSDLVFYGDVKSRSKIFIFDLEKREWIDTLIYNKEGENGIGTMNGFYIKSVDSIYVIDSFGGNIHLMNQNQKLRTYNTKIVSEDVNITPFPTDNSLSGIVNNKLIFFGFPEINSKEKDFYNKAKIGQAVDLTSERSYIGGGYPQNFYNHTYPGVSMLFNSQLIYQNKIIHSYSLSDSVYFFDDNFEIEKSILIRSPTKNETPFYDNKISDKESEQAYFDFYQAEGYGKIHLYNDKILIRKFYYSEADRDSFDSFVNYEKTIQTGLLFYDLEKAKMLGFIKFLTQEVDQYPMIITTEKGIYISKENPDEPVVDFYLMKWEEN
jgi:hypothetical protein